MWLKFFLKRVKKVLKRNTVSATSRIYFKKYNKYSFVDGHCKTKEQYEASITRLYHTVEKGLAYENYKAGFGKDKLELLLSSMKAYAQQYDTTEFFYRTALCCLNKYVEKNREHGLVDETLENKIKQLPGSANDCGGTIYYEPYMESDIANFNYEEFIKSRHSVRHFQSEEVDIDKLKAAVELAQFTPSACNRQGWRTRIIANKEIINIVLNNQNGNRGFGQEIDKILLVTSDVRFFNRDREVFQAFIDGGMYAQSIINSLYYYGIASVPLSASLLREQEKNIRKAVGIDDAEVFILIIGVGNYPDGEILTTRSERKPIKVQVI